MTNLGIFGNICGMKRRLITISVIAVLLVGCGVVYLTTLYRSPAAESKSGPVSIEEQERTIAIYQQQEAKADPPTEQSILNAVNTERAKAGVTPLQLHPGVSKAAQLKADDMVNKNYRHHELPENKNAIATPEMLSYIPMCSVYSENFVYNDYAISNKKAMNWWLNSPPHKAAMLDSKYTYTGIGISEGKVIVQWFCMTQY